MIQHIVMFRVRPEMQAQKAEIQAEIKRQLEALPAKIAEIRAFEVGINLLPSDRAYDLVLVSAFDTLDTLAQYAQHPDHLVVVDYIRAHCSSIVACDYER